MLGQLAAQSCMTQFKYFLKLPNDFMHNTQQRFFKIPFSIIFFPQTWHLSLPKSIFFYPKLYPNIMGIQSHGLLFFFFPFPLSFCSVSDRGPIQWARYPPGSESWPVISALKHSLSRFAPGSLLSLFQTFAQMPPSLWCLFRTPR